MPKYRFEDIAINCTEKIKQPSEADQLTYIGLEHLDSGSLYVNRYGSAVPIKGEKLVMHKGDVLFGKRNAYLRRAAIAPHDGIFSAHGMVFRPKEKFVDKDFFPLFIASDYFFDAAIKISVGSLSPTVNWKDLREIEFTIPDLETQRKLADVLWAMNDTMEAYKKLLATTDDMVKARFVEMFGDENKYPYIRLDEAFKVSSGLTKNPKRSSFSKKMPYLRVANVLFDYIDLGDVQTIGVMDVEICKTLLQKGDVLFVEGNGSPEQIGRVAIWNGQIDPMLHQNHIIKARSDEGKILPQFCMYYFMTQNGRNQILNSARTTSGLYTLSLSKISAFKLPLVPLEEQKSFLQLMEQSKKSKSELQKALTELTTLYKRILQDHLV